MATRDRCHPLVVLALMMIAPLVLLAAQPAPNLFNNLDALRNIPAPAPMTIRPRIFAAYGALITAAMLGTLYLHRGRAFIVYWIGSWVMVAASFLLLARGYADLRLGSVMIGLAELLGAWSAGLTLLAAGTFPDQRMRWDSPIRFAAVTAVWFLAAPFVLPLKAVLTTGPALTGALWTWAAVRYLRLVPRTRYIGAFVIGAALIVLSVTSAAALGAVLRLVGSTEGFNSLLAFNMIVFIFIALGMHVLVFEDMTDELRRTNRDLARANQEVKRLVITDPLTGCHNRRFFDEIERREIQRHRRYGSPLSMVFVDVNHFKRLNDTMGHDTGDEVLKTIGALLRRHIRESDYVIRWGGDEFLLLLTCSLKEAQRKGDELKRAFELENETRTLPDGIGLSIGVAAADDDADDLREAIRVADGRMYRDKLGERPGAE